MTTGELALVVPVKAFRVAKARLASLLDPQERAALSRLTATLVVRAAGSARPYVVCDDDDVAAWAADVGASVLWRPGLGLNAAVADAVATVISAGHDGVVVAHADLPLADDLAAVSRVDEIVLVHDRVLDGTNVIALPRGAVPGFVFDYGPRSFERHVVHARATGLPVRIVHDDRLALDLDTPDDLLQPELAGLLDTIRARPEGTPSWTPPPTSPASHLS